MSDSEDERDEETEEYEDALIFTLGIPVLMVFAMAALGAMVYIAFA